MAINTSFRGQNLMLLTLERASSYQAYAEAMGDGLFSPSAENITVNFFTLSSIVLEVTCIIHPNDGQS